MIHRRPSMPPAVRVLAWSALTLAGLLGCGGGVPCTSGDPRVCTGSRTYDQCWHSPLTASHAWRERTCPDAKICADFDGAATCVADKADGPCPRPGRCDPPGVLTCIEGRGASQQPVHIWRGQNCRSCVETDQGAHCIDLDAGRCTTVGEFRCREGSVEVCRDLGTNEQGAQVWWKVQEWCHGDNACLLDDEGGVCVAPGGEVCTVEDECRQVDGELEQCRAKAGRKTMYYRRVETTVCSNDL